MADELNLDKLGKLLSLTSSSNDNEALAAVRLANKMLRESNRSWADVLFNASRFENLAQQHNVLISKYNQLLAAIAAIKFRPARGSYRRRFGRL